MKLLTLTNYNKLKRLVREYHFEPFPISVLDCLGSELYFLKLLPFLPTHGIECTPRQTVPWSQIDTYPICIMSLEDIPFEGEPCDTFIVSSQNDFPIPENKYTFLVFFRMKRSEIPNLFLLPYVGARPKLTLDIEANTYNFPALYTLKKELNKSKSRLDVINANQKDAKVYERIADIIRLHESLRGPKGLVVTKFGGEIVTNAWLKMYEILNTLSIIHPEIFRGEKMQTLSFAEAPGNFILAMNQFFATRHPSLDWKWLANTYRDPKEGSQYLGDSYGLMSRFENQWLYGPEKNGDITSSTNLASFEKSCLEKWGSKAHLVTSDVKFAPRDSNLSEQENENKPVQFGHLLGALMCLQKGGIMVLKEFTYFEASSVSYMYLASTFFEKLYIYKPSTSRPANSEVYVIGIGFLDNLTNDLKQTLLKLMDKIRPQNTSNGSPALFPFGDISNIFLLTIIEMNKKLTKLQDSEITRNINLFRKYHTTPFKDVYTKFWKLRTQVAEDWVAIQDVRILPENKALLKSKDTYFKTDRDPKYKNLTKYNNYVKYTMLSALEGSLNVLDLGSGRGSDLFLYSSLGIRNLICCDQDPEALEELRKRSKHLGDKTFYVYGSPPEVPMSVETIVTDLREKAIVNISKIGSRTDIDAVVCNLAIHYFVSDVKTLDNFAQLVEKYSKKIFLTCMNGKAIFNLLLNTAKGQVFAKHTSVSSSSPRWPRSLTKAAIAWSVLPIIHQVPMP